MKKIVLVGIGILIFIDIAIFVNFVTENNYLPVQRVMTEKLVYQGGLVIDKKGQPYTGVYRIFYDDDKVREEVNYKQGVVDGAWRRYYVNGSLEYEYIAKGGNRYLSGKSFYKNGRIQGVVEEVNGFTMIKRYDILGNVISEEKLHK